MSNNSAAAHKFNAAEPANKPEPTEPGKVIQFAAVGSQDAPAAERFRLPLTIYTDYSSSAGARRTSEVAAISDQLTAIFYFVRKSCEGHDFLDLQNDQMLLDFDEFRSNVHAVCQFGEALADRLTATGGNQEVGHGTL